MSIPRSTLVVAEVEAGLAGTPFVGNVHAFASVGSTNALAVEAAQAGVRTGVWVADEQTAGRGRGGHTWLSAPGDGLYVSVLLRPRLLGADVLKISLAAGLAAVRAVGMATGAGLALRWPNDLMDGTLDGEGKKLGGILTESGLESGEGRLSYAVVGIGINLNQRAMPAELAPIATSLRMSWRDEETRREVLLPLLLRELAGEVAELEREVAGEALAAGIVKRFEAACAAVRGARVQVAEEGGYTGLTDGLEASGLLRVRADDGTLRIVRHGGVRRA